MTVRLDGALIRLEGEGRVEDAEALLALLQAPGGMRHVSLDGSGRLHTAVVQVLLVLRPPVSGTPSDEFAARWLGPLLGAAPPV